MSRVQDLYSGLKQITATVSAWLLVGWCAAASPAVEIAFARFDDPTIVPLPMKWDLSPRPLPLWIAALSAPEADIRRETALTIVLAKRLGTREIKTTIPALRKALDDPKQHPTVVAAVAHALIELDDREAAPSLAARAEQGGLELAAAIEPALARWDYSPIRKRWLDRLEDGNVRRALLVLAIEGLAAVGETSATPRLEELASGRLIEPGVRIAAARALAKLRPEGLEERAGELASLEGSSGMVDRLVGAHLLRRHASEEAMGVLARLALDPEPAVAAAALERLMEHDFRLVLPLAERLAASGDANIRHVAAKAWTAERTPGAIGRLGPMLDDPHPAVRRDVREALLDMATEAPLLDPVLEASKAELAANRWRGLEQSIVIMAALDREETATRMVELLEFERPEVYVAAAWGLRLVAVQETRSAVLNKAERIHQVQSTARAKQTENAQFQHLAEAMQVLHADEALPLLRKYVPKSFDIDPDSRAAAIWTTGHLLAGKPEPDLVKQFSERLADVASMPPEFPPVRLACAISLGRMKAEDALPTLRQHQGSGPIYDPVSFACGWAIHQITGGPLPEFADPGPMKRTWFLEPVE